MTEDPDVVIVGAGPVGLTLALSLARAGIRSTLLEQKAELDAHSRATLLVPGSVAFLAELGLLASFRREGQINAAVRILRAGDRRQLLSFDFESLSGRTPTPYAIAIPQDRTERILLNATAQTGLVDMRFGHQAVSVEEAADAVTVTTESAAGSDEISCEWLVGADGAHSAVRAYLGWRLEGRTYPTRAFLADVQVRPDADVENAWLADASAPSFTLAIRFKEGTWRIIESAIPETVSDADLPDRAKRLAERLFGTGAHLSTVWAAAYMKHERRAPSYVRGRIILAGDAAHLNSPAGGQGLNAGIADIRSLTPLLARVVMRGEEDKSTLLNLYDVERRSAFDHRIRPLTNGLERMETLPRWARAATFSGAALVQRTSIPRRIAELLAMLPDADT